MATGEIQGSCRLVRGTKSLVMEEVDTSTKYLKRRKLGAPLHQYKRSGKESAGQQYKISGENWESCRLGTNTKFLESIEGHVDWARVQNIWRELRIM